ncbi:MAG: diacylglycerol kinase family lipid kinase [Myxococcales bacterium]|nr:diacylglycerol kinase family lipid kinase [Myxococcales bacterium]MCB9525502.1 diacylglycerol kinase family lipid kinase [Myxococcales bacterium]
MSETVYAVVNPASAGGKTGRRWPELAAHLRRRVGELEVGFTEHSGHGIELVQGALRRGITHVVSVGGDGTLNEVVNGFFQNGAPINPRAILSLVPTGTGGDTRRSLGLPADTLAAIEQVGASPQATDVGRLTCVGADGQPLIRHFINIASFGIGGLVDKLVNEGSKALGGKASFLWATLKAGVKYDNQAVRFRLDDGEPFERTVLNGVVANARYFGGGMHVAPTAKMGDGRFEVVVIGDMGFVQLTRNMPKLYKGEHLALRDIEHFQATRVHAEPVQPDMHVLIDLDGEQPGRLPATLELLPGAIRLCRAPDAADD